MKKRIGLLMVLVLAAGCNPVLSRKPVGVKTADLEAMREKLEGEWMTPEGDAVRLTVADAAAGTVEVRYHEMEEGKPVERTMIVHFRETDSVLFASTREEKTEPEAFSWGRVAVSDRVMFLHIPNAEKVAAEVTAGRLAGTVTDTNKVMLGDLTGEQLKRLAADEAAPLYHWTEPAVLLRKPR